MSEQTNIITKDLSKDTSEYELNPDLYKNLEDPSKMFRNTFSMRGYSERRASLLKEIYDTQNLIPLPKLWLIIGTLIGRYITMANIGPDYRIDKSPTSSVSSDLYYQIDIYENLSYQYLEIKDQPKYFHNDIYALAKKIGFPTEFEL
jgi:hypothetical protein